MPFEKRNTFGKAEKQPMKNSFVRYANKTIRVDIYFAPFSGSLKVPKLLLPQRG